MHGGNQEVAQSARIIRGLFGQSHDQFESFGALDHRSDDDTHPGRLHE